MEQIQFGNGFLDDQSWTSKYTSVFGQTELKKIGTLDTSYDLQNGLSDAQKCELIEGFREMSDLVSDPIIYGLMMLVVSSRPIEGVSMESIAKLNSIYSLLIRRRVSSKLFCKEKQRDPTHLQAKISRSFSNVEKLAKIFGYLSVQ